MAFLKVKSTVRPWSLLIAAAVINAAQEVGMDEDMVITSGNDSTHKPKSKHYTHEALDFRTKHLTYEQKAALQNAIKRRLGKHFDVIVEALNQPNEHLHIERDVKR